MSIEDDYIKKLYEVINEIGHKLPITDVEYIKEFIEHDEWGLAFETLCTQLYEYEIYISPEIYNKISYLGEAMEFDNSVWINLRELIQK